MKGLKVKISIDELSDIIAGTYKHAIKDLGFRPEQAFAYVLEETDYAVRKDGKPLKFVWQVMVYMHGLKNGLVLSEESDYASDMLDLLCEGYLEFRSCQLAGLGISEEKIATILRDAEIVKDIFLRGRCV
ncbi:MULTISPECIES: hypothetical protein [Pseudomonas]|uniref:Uncharacterized protein n=1 Tax=Pseudomonas quercus TaxID=2722792 RepID=A0ABX0YL29_9PSED|nr:MULTISPECIES: hypothetical protein [Pseudomonas]MBF7145026.1 hypothetical protein [Pseudomonas sp. LY10J]NJP03617.1 hypothetical protein [Pseudomonas quercus]